MKQSTSNKRNYIFWTLVFLMIATICTVTAGTYFQYKVALNDTEIGESTSMAYTMFTQTKGFIFLVGTFF